MPLISPRSFQTDAGALARLTAQAQSTVLREQDVRSALAQQSRVNIQNERRLRLAEQAQITGNINRMASERREEERLDIARTSAESIIEDRKIRQARGAAAVLQDKTDRDNQRALLELAFGGGQLPEQVIQGAPVQDGVVPGIDQPGLDPTDQAKRKDLPEFTKEDRARGTDRPRPDLFPEGPEELEKEALPKATFPGPRKIRAKPRPGQGVMLPLGRVSTARSSGGFIYNPKTTEDVASNAIFIERTVDNFNKSLRGSLGIDPSVFKLGTLERGFASMADRQLNSTIKAFDDRINRLVNMNKVAKIDGKTYKFAPQFMYERRDEIANAILVGRSRIGAKGAKDEEGVVTGFLDEEEIPVTVLEGMLRTQEEMIAQREALVNTGASPTPPATKTLSDRLKGALNIGNAGLSSE